MHKYIDSQRRLLVSAKVQPETASSPLRLSPPLLHLVHLMAGAGGRGRGSCKEFHATLCHPVCCLCNKANCCNPFCKAHQLLLLLLAARCSLPAARCMLHGACLAELQLRFALFVIKWNGFLLDFACKEDLNLFHVLFVSLLCIYF